VVVNDIARADIGFEGPQNEVTIVTARDERHVERASKAEVARAVLDVVGELRATAEHQAGAS
jgi:phosphopantothenoylcysteine synthetase/decarboxylase